jgi:hypothetical protein
MGQGWKLRDAAEAYDCLSPFAKELLRDTPNPPLLADILRTVATYSCDENGVIMAAVSELDFYWRKTAPLV